MRLDQFLGETGQGSRNQIKRLLKSKQVRIDGEVVSNPAAIVDSGLQKITVTGQAVQSLPHRYYVLDKPAGAVTAVTDKEHQTVLDCIRPEDRSEGLYPIGRLDWDTEGLVLLTDNGPLGFRMLHPKYHVTKTYYVEVNDFLGVDAVPFFQEGVRFLDGTSCKPAQLSILSSDTKKSCARVTISEGKFYQVKKMFLAYGVKVTYLKRISFGNFHLEADLPAGHYRELTSEEQMILKTYLG
ncbi:pseudouridine synthase [Streptococcus ovis]|uniref:pseudouridine synthase n=1 Tax=Streptococcus ovis TaxID=82806 RepID=UPI00037D9D41|nr:pseudouridine synthase [Streptococcus ovis]